jgi:hypothetical protein
MSESMSSGTGGARRTRASECPDGRRGRRGGARGQHLRGLRLPRARYRARPAPPAARRSVSSRPPHGSRCRDTIRARSASSGRARRGPGGGRARARRWGVGRVGYLGWSLRACACCSCRRRETRRPSIGLGGSGSGVVRARARTPVRSACSFARSLGACPDRTGRDPRWVEFVAAPTSPMIWSCSPRGLWRGTAQVRPNARGVMVVWRVRAGALGDPRDMEACEKGPEGTARINSRATTGTHGAGIMGFGGRPAGLPALSRSVDTATPRAQAVKYADQLGVPVVLI